MNECAPGSGDSIEFQAASVVLCAAQRAFAASLERPRDAGEFRDALRRGAARRTLSALSADDRTRLADWLSLLLATGDSLPRRVSQVAVTSGTSDDRPRQRM